MVICGIDEVGRGPLAGPVTAAAVVLPLDFDTGELADSKVLSAAERARIKASIIASGAAVGIGWVGPEEIDSLNIHQATLEAMSRAYRDLVRIAGAEGRALPDEAVVDGRFCPDLPISCTAVVGGDRTVPSIQAASIIAKEARDRFMRHQATLYPQYGFQKHVGYPTPFHRRVLKELGPCPIHRRSFRGVVSE